MSGNSKEDMEMVQRSEKIRMGIIGTGRIAGRFVAEAGSVDQVGLTAVYNPHEESARKFAESHGIPMAFDEAESFWDEVDAVYIASPHETHEEYLTAALEHDKHVICEKPMILDGHKLTRLFGLSHEKNLVLMEGIKTVYCPGYRGLMQKAKSGMIGEVLYIESSFTKIEKDDSRELTDRSFGGSFTELGTYGLLPVFDLFGIHPSEIRFDSIRDEKGIDLFTKAELSYDDVRFATVKTGLKVKTEGILILGGTEGYIRVDAPWWKTSSFGIFDKNGNETGHFEIPFEGDGLRYELKAFCDRIGDHPGGAEDSMEEISRGCASVMAEFLDRRGN